MTSCLMEWKWSKVPGQRTKADWTNFNYEKQMEKREEDELFPLLHEAPLLKLLATIGQAFIEGACNGQEWGSRGKRCLALTKGTYLSAPKQQF